MFEIVENFFVIIGYVEMYFRGRNVFSTILLNFDFVSVYIKKYWKVFI